MTRKCDHLILAMFPQTSGVLSAREFAHSMCCPCSKMEIATPCQPGYYATASAAVCKRMGWL